MSEINKEDNLIEKYKELENLKKEISVQIQDIEENSDEETLQKINKVKKALSEHKRDYNNTDIDKNIKALSKLNEGLSTYQRFKNAFEKDVNIDPGRLMGLTDGIFGMVMTLLIFGMALPEFEIVNSYGFASFINSILPTFGITLVSFILLASFWLYHHEFIKINNLNIPYLWLNIFYLASISFIPFTTSIIGTYPQFFLSHIIFGLNVLITVVFFIIMFRYAYNRRFLEERVSVEEKKYIYHTFYIIMAVTITVNILDFTVSNNFIYLFFIIPIISTFRDIQYKLKHS